MRLNIYLFTLILFNVCSLSLRRLEFDDNLTQICKEAEIDYKSIDQTFSEYTKKFAKNSTDTLTFFENILKDHTDIQIELILRKVGIYVFVLVLAIVVFISWVCFGLCCLCGCSLFKKRESKRGFLFKIIILGLFGVLIVLGISAIGLSSAFGQYFSGSVCSFFQVFNHTLKGDFKISEDSPRWIGLNNVEKEFNKTIDNLNEIVEDLSNETTKFETNFSAYSEEFQELLNREIETNVSYPISIEQQILADYSLAYPKLVETISEQYSTIKTSFDNGIDQIQTQLEELSSLDQKFDLTSIKEQIDTTSDSITSFREKFSGKVMMIYDNVSSNMLNAFRVVFGLFISFAVIGLVIFILNSFSTKCTCKCVVHLLWIGLLLFIIAALIVGSVLGIAGTIAGELIIVLPYMLDEEFLSKVEILNTFGDSQEILSYINVCLEGNGSIISKFNINLEIEGFETLMNESKAMVKDFKNKIQNYSNIEELQNFTTSIQSYHDDYSLAFSKIDSDIFPEILLSLNDKFGDTYSDIFVTNKTNCPDEKTYLPPSESRGEQGNYCLVVHEWEPNQIQNMYPGLNDLFIEFETLYTFINDNNRVTEGMLTVSQNMELIFDNIILASDNFTGEVNNSIISVEAFYNTTMGNDGAIANKFNCGFIKDDVIIFIDQLFNGFTNQASKVGAVSIICSVIAYFAVVMLIISINSEKKDKEKEKEKIRRDDSITELILQKSFEG